LLQLRAHPLAEARDCAERMLPELRKLIPAFLTRVDRQDRGVRWSAYLAETRLETKAVAERLLEPVAPEPRPEVALTDFDPDGEVKVVAAALYESSRLPDDQLLNIARGMDVAPTSCGPTSGAAGTGGIGRAARSSGPPTVSTCCRTTARSAISNATDS
jgi:hypothetical protein